MALTPRLVVRLPAPAFRSEGSIGVNVNARALDPVRFVATTGTLGALVNGATYAGLTLATGDRFLYQPTSGGISTPGTTVGIYVVGVGAPTRATDADTGAELLNASVFVTAGTPGAGQSWVNVNSSAPAVGTDNIIFRQFNASFNEMATFDTRVTAAAASIPSTRTMVQVLATATAGDGGDAVYKKVGSPPAHNGKFQSADGAWWEIAEPIFHPGMFGAKGDNSTNDATAFTDAIAACGTVETSQKQRGVIKSHARMMHTIGSTLALENKSIKLEDVNVRWTGAAATVFSVIDCARLQFRDMVVLGSTAFPPTEAFYLEAPTSARSDNELVTFRNVAIGRRSTAPAEGDQGAYPCVYGIRIGGAFNGNNDEYRIEDCRIHDCSGAGLKIDNAQSIWGHISGSLFDQCGIGIDTGASITCYNVQINYANKSIALKNKIQGIFHGLFAENVTVLCESTAGAWLQVFGGKCGRTNSTAGLWIDVQTGGPLTLNGLWLFNITTAVDQIKWRAASLAVGTRFESQRILVRNCTFENSAGNIGDKRDFWDIHSDMISTVTPEIDIEYGKFVWKTRMPYCDFSYSFAASLANGASEMATQASTRQSQGRFYTASISVDTQNLHIVPMVQANATRVRAMNMTGAAVTLATPCRVRVMDLSEYVDRVGIATIDPPSLASNAGSTQTITVPGARLGDFAVSTVNGAQTAVSHCAHVSAVDTVTVRIHNQSGGTSDQPSQTWMAATVKPLGNFLGFLDYAGSTVADAAQLVLSVPVPGAQLGSHCLFAYSSSLGGLFVTAECNAADTVSVIMSNRTGAGVVLAAGVMRAMAMF